jgi:hypothetical protein
MATTLNSTTLSAALTKTAQSLTVASVSNIAVGDLLVIGRETMLVNAIVGTRLDVQRGYFGAPQAYSSGKKVWTGTASRFYASAPSGDAVAANELYLPHIVLPQGEFYDVVQGKWVKVQDEPADATAEAVFYYTAAGAITIARGTHRLKAGSGAAMTLANPTADDEGKVMRLQAADAQAYTVTVTGGFAGGGAGVDVATFGGAIGDGMTVVAVNLLWHIVATKNITLG